MWCTAHERVVCENFLGFNVCFKAFVVSFLVKGRLARSRPLPFVFLFLSTFFIQR
jgi:hypothetical protein